MTTLTTTTVNLQRLAELLDDAARIYADAESHAARALYRYCEAGKAFLAAREVCPYGQWHRVVNEHGMHYTTVARLMRLATYWDDIPPEQKAGDLPYRAGKGVVMIALESITDKPATRKYPETKGHLAKEAAAMRVDGATLAEIADSLECSQAMVWRLLNPSAAKLADQRAKDRRREAHAAMAALKRERDRKHRDDVAKSASSELSAAYAAVRKLSLALDAALSTLAGESHRELRDAATFAVSVETHIMRSIKADRVSA